MSSAPTKGIGVLALRRDLVRHVGESQPDRHRPGQEISLIEPPGRQAGGVQGNGDDAGRPRGGIPGPSSGQEAAEGFGQSPAAAVLQGLDRRADRTLVGRHRSGHLESRRMPEASEAAG